MLYLAWPKFWVGVARLRNRFEIDLDRFVPVCVGTARVCRRLTDGGLGEYLDNLFCGDNAAKSFAGIRDRLRDFLTTSNRLGGSECSSLDLFASILRLGRATTTLGGNLLGARSSAGKRECDTTVVCALASWETCARLDGQRTLRNRTCSKLDRVGVAAFQNEVDR